MPEKSLRGAPVADVGSRLRILTAEEQAQIRAERAARVAEWAKLPLRQTFADERWMRAHLSAAGLRFGSAVEPATVARMRQKLRSVGILDTHVKAAVGGTLEQFLALNPNLPLWAAVALMLEADGTYRPEEIFA